MLEALDSGCAIVTTPVGGARDCVVEGRNGTIVASPSPDALAAATSAFVVSEERRRIAHAISRERARDFEIGRMVDRLVTLYRDAAHDAA
jgi:glycosyltransferase involved in cell wall biosynthesis